MAMHRSHINAGSNTYGGLPPAGYPVQHPFIETERNKHYIVGYSANYNSESYESKNEKVEFRQIPTATIHNNGFPRKELNKDHGVGLKPLPPWGSTRDQPEKVEEFPPKVIPSHKNYRDSSPPPRDKFQTTHDHGKYKKLNSFDKDDDIVCNDGVCVKDATGGTKPNYFKEEDYDHNEKKKGNGYVPPHANYTSPVSIQPRNHEPSHIDNYEKYKGNGYNPPSYTIPVKTQPRKDTYYKPSHMGNTEKDKGNGYAPPSNYTLPITQPRKDNYETPDNRSMMLYPPPPIKTRSDHRGREHYNSPTRKDPRFQEIIDSAEARRRYGKGLPRAEEENYIGTIDCREAAKKYNGVFVTD